MKKKIALILTFATLYIEADEFKSRSIHTLKDRGYSSCQISQEPTKEINNHPTAKLKNFFISRDDMCEGTDTHTCTNGFESVRNLQIALNADKSLDVTLSTDGKWGDKTKEAVMRYQKLHHITPVDGWVGKTVKRSLDKTASDVKYPSDYFSRQEDMCEATPEFTCTNDYNAIRNLQIALSKDKVLHVNLKTDGKWGKTTKEAVIAYQKYYGLDPIDGWVGREVKQKLDNTSKGILFPKNKISEEEKGIRGNQGSVGSFESFKKHTNLSKSFNVYKNPILLRQSTRKNTTLTIDESTQRITLYVKGKVALNSPCTTGAKHKFEPNTKIYRDKHTPLGNFRILEKIRDKRSTIFGIYFRNGKQIYKGDRRKFQGDKHGARYVGASLLYWMRLTGGGIGLHASKYVKRHPGTNGCIRLPKHVAKLIFSKVAVGTRVKIQR